MLSRLKKWIPRPNLGVILGGLALMVALGGTAAANLPGKNSVNSGDIKASNVKASDIKDAAVGAPEIGADAVGTSELGPGSVHAADLGTIIERSTTIQVINGSQNNTTVNCLAGEVVIGGGNDWSALNTGVRLQRSQRVGNGWNIAGANDSGSNKDLTVIAYCLQV